MNLLMFLFKSGLQFEEIVQKSEERVDSYRQVLGLIQKYYVIDSATGQVGGVFLFDSEKTLAAFRDSDLAKSTGEVYKFQEPPHTKVLELAKVLRE